MNSASANRGRVERGRRLSPSGSMPSPKAVTPIPESTAARRLEKLALFKTNRPPATVLAQCLQDDLTRNTRSGIEHEWNNIIFSLQHAWLPNPDESLPAQKSTLLTTSYSLCQYQVQTASIQAAQQIRTRARLGDHLGSREITGFRYGDESAQPLWFKEIVLDRGKLY